MLRRLLAALVLLANVAAALILMRSVPHQSRISPSRIELAKNLSQLPLTFELNAGQANSGIDFLARTRDYTLLIRPTEALFSVRSARNLKQNSDHDSQSSVVTMHFVHANPDAKITGQKKSSTISNYFIGNDPKKWRTGIPAYQTLRVHELYDGIDLLYYGKGNELEHDLVVAPGKNPGLIGISFPETTRLQTSDDGDLMVGLADGQLHLKKPRIYQQVGGSQVAIEGGYTLQASHQVGFHIGKYDQNQPLVIDPVIVFSTYLGGNADDSIRSMAVDSQGNIYVVGITGSANFPLQNPFQPGLNCVTANTPCPISFVTKFNPTASSLVYSTFFGGTNGPDGDLAVSVAVDADENVYISGIATSSDFPTTFGAFSTTYVTGPGQCGGGNTCTELYVSKFASSGSVLDYSTYLGAAGGLTAGGSLTVDGMGRAFLTGITNSPSFPTTAGAFQTTCTLNPVSSPTCFDSGFVTVLNQAGSALVYSTYLGANNVFQGSAIAVDATGSAIVIGQASPSNFPLVNPLQSTPANGFFAKLKPDGSGLIYSSYLGGNGQTLPSSLAIDSNGNVLIAGWTNGTNFPTTPGAFQTTVPSSGNVGYGFVSKIDPSAATLLYSTYFGGGSTGTDTSIEDIAVDSLGQAYVTGGTNWTNFPQVNSVLPNYAGGSCVAPGQNQCVHAFVSVFNAQGSGLLFSTLLGGSNVDGAASIAIDQNQSIYVAGSTNSSDFPVVNAFQATYGGGGVCPDNAPCFDGFLTKLQLGTLAATPVSLTFPDQPVGTSSASQAVVISNSTSQTVQISSITVPAGFSETDNCLGALLGNSTCTVNVTFSPLSNGPQTGNLAINNNGPGGTYLVALTGTAIQPKAPLSVTSLQFSSQALGTTSDSQTVTLTNNGTDSLAINSVTASGDFAIGPTCNFQITAGTNCTIGITFTPTAAGTRTGSLSIVDNAADSPQQVTLTGTGTGSAFALAPAANGSTTATVAAGTPASFNLQLQGVKGVSSTVTLAADCSAVPANTSCLLSTQQLQVSGTTPIGFSLSVGTTTFSHLYPYVPFPGPFARITYLPALELLTVFFFIVLIARRLKDQRFIRPRFALCAELILLSILLASCSSGGSSGGPTGTPPGSYSVKVTATSQGSSQVLNLTIVVH